MIRTPPRYVLLFSTDCEVHAAEIYHFYKARFQMEFLFRDAKQWTGLSECQARDQQALHFHFNASLSAANLAKIAQAQAAPFSLAPWKQKAFNEHLLHLFIENLELAELSKNPSRLLLSM